MPRDTTASSPALRIPSTISQTLFLILIFLILSFQSPKPGFKSVFPLCKSLYFHSTNLPWKVHVFFHSDSKSAIYSHYTHYLCTQDICILCISWMKETSNEKQRSIATNIFLKTKWNRVHWFPFLQKFLCIGLQYTGNNLVVTPVSFEQLQKRSETRHKQGSKC